MLKPMDIVFLGLVLAAATATYVVKYGSEIESDKIARLEQQIEVEKEAIDILEANWSLLTNPARIQTLTQRYGDELNLGILQPEQITTIEQIPLRALNSPDAEKFASGNDGISDTITGSIKTRDKQ